MSHFPSIAPLSAQELRLTEGQHFLFRWGHWLAMCRFELDLFDCWTHLHKLLSAIGKGRRKRGKSSFRLRWWPCQGVAASVMSEPSQRSRGSDSAAEVPVWAPPSCTAPAVKVSEPPLLHLTLVHFYLVKSAIVHIAAMYC